MPKHAVVCKPAHHLTLASPDDGQPDIGLWDDRMFPDDSTPVGQVVCLEYVRGETGEISARRVFLPDEKWPSACGTRPGDAVAH